MPASRSQPRRSSRPKKASARSTRAPAAGRLSAAGRRSLSKDELQQRLGIYRWMLFLRLLDDRMLTLQRQGRIGFYGSCYGQEAATLASAAALRPDDWIFPALREAGAMLLRGYPLMPFLCQIFGNAADPAKGRQMPSHQSDRDVHQVSWSSVIGSQLPQAVGAAHASKLRGEDRVMLAYLGDGATSSADFHHALTFAARFQVPVIFACQNNQWSISVPLARQTAVRELAEKGAAYGIPSRSVDGNDLNAVFEATAEAVQQVRSGGGPRFLELVTYRLGAHSSSDDPTRYRDPKEVERWLLRDPIASGKKWAIGQGLWSEAMDKSFRKKADAEIVAAIARAEASPRPEADTLFDDVYAEPPWILAEQREMLRGELAAAPRIRP